MAFLFGGKGRQKQPAEIAKALKELLPKLWESPVSPKIEEDAAKLMAQMKLIVQGTPEVDCSPEQVHQLVSCIIHEDLLYELARSIRLLPFEARKDAQIIFSHILRWRPANSSPQSEPSAVSYLVRDRPEIIVELCWGYNDAKSSMPCGTILRHALQFDTIAAVVLYDESTRGQKAVRLKEVDVSRQQTGNGVFWNFFQWINKGSFEVSADAFTTFREILTKHKNLVSQYLATNYDMFFSQYYNPILLLSQSYVTKRQSIKLLGELLLDRSNYLVMTQYVASGENLKLTMSLLKDDRKMVQYEAFHVFKVFVANPNKSDEVRRILVKNRERLLRFLPGFLEGRTDDDQFLDEKSFLVRQIELLPSELELKNGGAGGQESVVPMTSPLIIDSLQKHCIFITASAAMSAQTSLFQVYLRLRPPMSAHPSEQWMVVEPPSPAAEVNNNSEDAPEELQSQHATHIVLQPPNDSRKRAIERFGFTKVFQQDASQQELFKETGAADNIVRGLLQTGRDGLIATLGVTGSGKSYTTLGSRSQRGITQMSLDVVFRSIGSQLCCVDDNLVSSLQASDPSEAHILPASTFLEQTYESSDRARLSRAQTPLSRGQTPMVRIRPCLQAEPGLKSFPCLSATRETTLPFWQRLSIKKPLLDPLAYVGLPQESTTSHRKLPLPNTSSLPSAPDVSSHTISIDSSATYAVIVSMYEVYNDRIFDLLSSHPSTGAAISTRAGAALQKSLMRRPLLFKNTEASLDRKVVAGLKKVVCSSYEEAMLVLEAGLTERRVAGTGSNSVSSRSHGFFCIEVKRSSPLSRRLGEECWVGGGLSIADLAGSERARNAKTTGSTLAEAGKINESLMYLGQCLQVQSDCQQDGSKPIVPFRQCKLTELLFTNSFTPATINGTRAPQKAIMIVTADPQGDFNATSQILRYSALAREVTVPRVPSAQLQGKHGLPTPNHSGRTSPDEAAHDVLLKELEQATHEVERLSEECDALVMRLAEEEIRRSEAELRAQALEEKVSGVLERAEEAEARIRQEVEVEVREEVWKEMESMMDRERNRWRLAWEEERARTDEIIDEKIDLAIGAKTPMRRKRALN
ncbi:hypothetical protein DV736_g1074, partial [Chaetothyriales sp. CBS 134916]